MDAELEKNLDINQNHLKDLAKGTLGGSFSLGAGGYFAYGMGSFGWRYLGELYGSTTRLFSQSVDRMVYGTPITQQTFPLWGDVGYTAGFAGSVVAFGTGILSSVIGIAELVQIPGKIKEIKQNKQQHLRRIELFHPEWKENPPTEKQLETFLRSVSYLPPIGGKISVEGNWPSPIKPTLTAEEHVDKILQMRQELGRAYIHQLTVQGRQGDMFKYVATGLLINSPYKNNWDAPFFDAPWGKVAPMVHDGGVMEYINGYWAKEGRTDFLHRIAKVYEPELDDIEKLSVAELTSLPQERLDKARLEQFERGRLLLEARAYQRLALAFIAKGGYPLLKDNLGEERWLKLRSVAETYRNEMDGILHDFNVVGVVKVRWFNRKPRQWSRESAGRVLTYDNRFEADWAPIRRQLKRLEAVRWEKPELRVVVNGLLQTKTAEVDQIIGLA